MHGRESALLTGARLGEALASRKEDFDLQRGVWTKPSHQTKQKRTEHLPLSGQALTLIASIIETSNPPSPFPETSRVSRCARLKNLECHNAKGWHYELSQARQPAHLCVPSRFERAQPCSLEIVGRLLGHTTTTTTKRYAHLADDPLRAAADLFGSKIDSLQRAREANVFSLRSRT
jgi:integrase